MRLVGEPAICELQDECKRMHSTSRPLVEPAGILANPVKGIAGVMLDRKDC